MSVIKITVDDQNLHITDSPKIAAQGVNENYVGFTFSADWDGFGKTAIFYNESDPETVYTSLVDGNGLALIPHEITESEGRISLGLSGVKDNVVKTSEILTYKIVKGLYVAETSEPSPGIYEQMLTMVGAIQSDQETFIADIEADQAAFKSEIEASITEIENETSSSIAVIDARVDNLLDESRPGSVTTLWTGLINKSGESATLSENVSEFDFLDIYLSGVDTKYIRVSASQTSLQIQAQNMSDDGSSAFLYLWETGVTISGTTVSINKCILWSWLNPGTDSPTVTPNAQNGPNITRVDGVKMSDESPAELLDIRVGVDGTTYASAGAAVRTQVSDVKEDLINYEEYIIGKSDLSDSATWTEGYAIVADGSIVESSDIHYSSLIGVDNVTYHLAVKNNGSQNGTVRIHGYTNDGTWVEQITYMVVSASASANIPVSVANANIKAIRISAPKTVGILSLYTGDTLQQQIIDLGNETEELNQIAEKLQDLTSATSQIAITDGWVTRHYVNTNNPVGTVITVPEKEVSHANFNYIFLSVNAGDVFYLTGTGGGDPRVYAWLDTDHKLLSNSASGATVTNLKLIAPQNGYLVINVNTNYAYSLTRSVMVNIHSTTFDLADFGAVGDGVTDDTNAIQTALDVSAGHELYIPEGTYIFSKTLYIKGGTRIYGAGEKSVFKQADSFTFDSYPWRTGDSLVKDHNRYPMIMIESTENGCMLENFKLEGQTTAFIDKNCDGLTLFGNNHVINNLVVKNIDFFPADFASRTCDVPGYGICIMGSTITIKNCDMSECGYECVGTEDASVVTIEGCNVGFAVQTGVQVHRNSHSIRIINNRIRCYDGVSAYSPGLTIHAAQEYPMQDIFIDGNYIVSSFRIANGGGENDIRISNNYMVSIAVNAFAEQRDYRKNWIITGNTFTSGGIQAKCDGLIITNNIFNVNGSETVIHAKTNKYLIDNNLFAGTASEVIIEPH